MEDGTVRFEHQSTIAQAEVNSHIERKQFTSDIPDIRLDEIVRHLANLGKRLSRAVWPGGSSAYARRILDSEKLDQSRARLLTPSDECSADDSIL